ncbi:cyclodeaminase/cyclohydrolase family protein [Caloramator fervidus]|nr:cyclodeaminase/cyclohydrolase family protein [Caloramator fervidus]
MLIEKSVKEFVEETASSSPVPGGGSVAAFSGAVAAALSEMVANLTVGKKGYEDVQEDMKNIIEQAKKIRGNLLKAIDKDSKAFDKVMEAFKMPKDTEEEKEKRKKAIQEALKEAAIVPLDTAREAFKIFELSRKVIVNGNKNAITDGAVSCMMARTSILSALLNVKINLASIKDEEFVEKIKKEVEELEEKTLKLEKEILDKVEL